MTSNMLTVDLKITLDTIQRRFSLPTTCPAWDELATVVKEGFELPSGFKLGLCYQDQDGEYITISSAKELASIWPVVTVDDERDLDALPPLRFSVVNIPAHPGLSEFHGPPPPRHVHQGNDEHRAGHLVDGPGAHKGPTPPKDGPQPPKDGDKDSLRDDVHKFIEAVKTNVTENKDVQDAYKKVLEHTRGEHGPKKPDEAAAKLFGQVAVQADGSDALTSGIVAALLTPVFMGPPPPPHHGGPPGPPPHHGPRGPRHGPPHGPPHDHPHGPPPHGHPPRGHPPPPPHGLPGCGPPGCPPPPGFGPGHRHFRGPGGPPRGPGGPPRGPPPHHGRFDHGPRGPHGRHGGWGFGAPGRRFRGHPYHGYSGNYRRFADDDADTVDGMGSEIDYDSDIEAITQGVREMHRNRDAY